MQKTVAHNPVFYTMITQEAQRLINISLEKIASYRSQRGSSNLHKNVLVANVLRRVRTTTVEREPFCQVSNENLTPQEYMNDREDITCSECSDEAKPNDVLCRLAVHAGDVTKSHGNNDVSDFLVEDLKENELPNNVTNYSTTNDINKKLPSDSIMTIRNLKRRQSMTSEDCISVKRRKDCISDESMRWRVTRRLSVSDCDVDSETESNLDSVNDQECNDSPMDVEQICGLVSVFRSSFQGLGYFGSATTEQINTRESNSYSTTKTENRQNSSLRRGLSLPDLCAKQVSRQPFKMCSPALALTV